ncbi:MAG: response regulator [Nitrospirae bacterium]|nr:response regulator [Candidatus Manganitrophaceae bacterium]
MPNKSTVLIVDDEEGPRASLKMALMPFYQIEEATDGFQALDIVRRRKIDLVTLDLRMPQMDGTAVMMAIKIQDPHIEVLIITGYGTIPKAMELVLMGACGFLMKPFQIPRLLDDVARAIEKKKKSDRLNLQSH